MAERKWKHAANLAIIGAIYWIASDIYLDREEGQMTYSQALEYAKEKKGLWVVLLTVGLCALFIGHVFWRAERIVINWIRNLN